MDLLIGFTENKLNLFCNRCQKDTEHLRFEEDLRTGRVIWSCSLCKKKKATNDQGIARQEEILDDEEEGEEEI